jgi:hypothetical protein
MGRKTPIINQEVGREVKVWEDLEPPMVFSGAEGAMPIMMPGPVSLV